MLRIRVLTLNIWNREEPWEARLELMRRGIAKLAPDVIGIQEDVQLGNRRLSDEIKAGLGYESTFGIADELELGLFLGHSGRISDEVGPNLFLGNSVLSRFAIVAKKTIALPHGGTAERRSLLVTGLATPAGVLPFCVTHLNWRAGESQVRQAQIRAITDCMNILRRPSDLPAILVGDFNAAPNSKEMLFLRAHHWKDSYESIVTIPGHTFDALRNPFARRTASDRRRIDYIFVRAPGRPMSSSVVLDECVGGVCASDHFGVLAEIEI